MTGSNRPATVGAVVEAVVLEQLTEERQRKASLEARGLAVITSSGALVTLLLGIGALVSSKTDYRITTEARALLIVTAVAFVIAGIAGVICNVPLSYQEIDMLELAQLAAPDFWDRNGDVTAMDAVTTRVTSIMRGRELNTLKAIALVVGLSAEVVAVATAATAVIAILAYG